MSNTETLKTLYAEASAAYDRGDFATAEILDAKAEALADETFAEVGLAGVTLNAAPFQFVFTDG